MSRKQIVSIVLATTLGACSQGSSLISEAQKAVKDELADPTSPIFDRKYPPFVFPDLGLVCGSVNAKNSYGAYAGDTLYAYQRGEGAELIDKDPDHFQVLHARCMDASARQVAKMRGEPPPPPSAAANGASVEDLLMSDNVSDIDNATASMGIR